MVIAIRIPILISSLLGTVNYKLTYTWALKGYQTLASGSMPQGPSTHFTCDAGAWETPLLSHINGSARNIRIQSASSCELFGYETHVPGSESIASLVSYLSATAIDIRMYIYMYMFLHRYISTEHI